MKALLIKDLCIIKNTQRTMLALFILYGFVCNIFDQPLLCVGFPVIMCVMLSPSSIAYDEYDNGFPFLFSLPFSRREYVAEKYALSAVLSFGIWVITVAFNVVYSVVVQKHPITSDNLFVYISVLLLAVLPMCITLPLRFKFGSENGRILMPLCTGGCYAALFSVSSAFADTTLPVLHNGVIWFLSFFVVALLCWLSVRISIFIMEHKEF